MSKKAYILNDDPEYNRAAVKVRIASREDYPNMPELEVAKMILNEDEYSIWKTNYDEVQDLINSL
ncbi:MAG: hypothetical protein RR213_07255 [Raoultibacter sp.]